MRTPTAAARHGITLMEVLISIGILAIGLSSVAAILPAAKSQATRAVIFDRASNLAANVLADAATFGVIRQGALTQPLNPNTLITIDPAVGGSYITSGTSAQLRVGGVFSTAAIGTDPADTAILRLFTESRDDIVFGPPLSADGPDGLPTNAFLDGTRAYEGRFSAMIAVLPKTPPEMGRLSVVVFHNRDNSQPAVKGNLTGVSLTLTTIPDGRTFSEIVRPGAVFVSGTSFHQITSAAIPPGSTTAFVSFMPPAASGDIFLLPDSVGLAERPFTPEVNGPFLQ